MLRRSALLAAMLCLWTGSCIGPGLEPPGGDDDGADLGQNPVTPPTPGVGQNPENPTGMQPMVPGAGTAGSASEPMRPPTDAPAVPTQRDAGSAREDDAGTDDSGVKQ